MCVGGCACASACGCMKGEGLLLAALFLQRNISNACRMRALEKETEHSTKPGKVWVILKTCHLKQKIGCGRWGVVVPAVTDDVWVHQYSARCLQQAKGALLPPPQWGPCLNPERNSSHLTAHGRRPGGRQLRTERLVSSRKTEGGLMWKDGPTEGWTLLIATKRREANSSRGNRR